MTRYTDAAEQAAAQGRPPSQAPQAAAVARAEASVRRIVLPDPTPDHRRCVEGEPCAVCRESVAASERAAADGWAGSGWTDP